MPAAKPDDLSSIVRTKRWKKRANSRVLSSDHHPFATVCLESHARVHTNTYTSNEIIFLKSLLAKRKEE